MKSLTVAYAAFPTGGAYSGLKTVHLGLVPALAERLHVRGHKMALLCPHEMPESLGAGVCSRHRLPPGLWSENFRLPAAINRLRPDVVYYPTSRTPFLAPAAIPSVVTVHDLMFWRHPEKVGASRRWFRNMTTKLALKRASAVIADSEFTRRELVEYGYGRAITIHLAQQNQGGASRRRAAGGATPPDRGIRKPFFLFIGTQGWQKNLPNLVRAFGRFCDSESRGGLVLGGQRGTGTAELRETLAKVPDNVRARIVLVDPLSEEDKVRLYEEAMCFVFPSLYEGFGLPLLEAFSHGVPVIHSNMASLPEVAGQAGLASGPDDRSLCQAMLRMYREPILRDELVAAGRRRLKEFSWEKTAAKLCSVLEAAAESDRGRTSWRPKAAPDCRELTAGKPD